MKSTEPRYGFESAAAESFPPMVVMDVTNVCNLACVHCAHPVIKKQPDYHATFMAWEIWTKVMDEIARHPGVQVRVSGDGEPLLHPRLVEMLDYAKHAGVGPVDLTTNGKTLDRDTARAILETGIEAIDVSMDAVSAERYEAIRVRGNFVQLMENIETLLQVREELNAPTRVMVSIVDQAEAHAEVDAFRKQWETRVDKVLVRLEHQNLGVVAKGAKPVPADTLPKRWPCPQFWKRVTVTHKGYIRFCVLDWQEKSLIGDVRTHSIEEIWKSPPYREMRRRHLAGGEAGHPLCGPCTDWTTMPWDYGFDRVMREVIGSRK